MGKGVRSLTSFGQQFIKVLDLFSLCIVTFIQQSCSLLPVHCGVFSWFMVSGFVPQEELQEMCVWCLPLWLKVTALSWVQSFLKGFFHLQWLRICSSHMQRLQLAGGIVWKTPQSFFFLLVFCVSPLKEQQCDKHLSLHDLLHLFSVLGPKTEASTNLFFLVQGESYQWSSNTDPSVLVSTNALFHVCWKHQLRV